MSAVRQVQVEPKNEDKEVKKKNKIRRVDAATRGRQLRLRMLVMMMR